MDSGAVTGESSYDLFLSYNSADHGVVEDIARKLWDEGLKPFLDRWYLEPGIRWQSELQKTLSSCKAVAIFVGQGEMGAWQQREVDVALDLQSKNPNLPVIPVLLPGCEPPLGFLRQLTWVDLRTRAIDRGIVILVKAARGEPPGPEIQKHSDSVRASICPYRGLLHFREEDAQFFFGREAAVDNLANAVDRQPFVAVVGSSGSGKSSVVRAGLVPRLRSDRRTAWETVILVPTDRPLQALAMAFVPLLDPTMGEIDRLAEAAKLAEHFRSGTISLYDIVERILEKQSGTDRVLIFVDQFEELYTLNSDEEARRRFLDELLAASSRAKSKANIALTLRGDFVGKALAYRPLSDRLQDAQINLGPMTREELECAILKPAEKIQLGFESGLVKRIINDVGEEPGNLPLLEFVLKELWEGRRGDLLLNETYDVIGGLQGAVATKADELFKGFSSAEQKILQRVFLRIVRPSESGEDTRRRAAFTELPPEGAELVVRLANERLLVTNQSANGLEQTVEVAHEALIANWGTLRAWVNEDREFLLWRDRLCTLLTEWERAQESDEALLRGPLLIEAQKWFDQRSQDLSDEERKFISASRVAAEKRRQQQAAAAKSLRRLTWVLAAVAFVAVGGAIFGFSQKNEAENRKRDAEIANAEAKRQEAIAKENANKERVSRNTAEKQAQAAQRALTDSYLRTIGVSSGQNLLPQGEREALWELAQLDPANAIVRENVLNRWLGTAEAFVRGQARAGQGFRAATGLNVEYDRRYNAQELGRALATALENPQERDPIRLSLIVNALTAVAANMEPQDAAELANGLGAEIANPTDETNYSLESSLTDALKGLVNKMQPQAVEELAQRFAAVFSVRTSQTAGVNHFNPLGAALDVLADRMESQAASTVAQGLATVLETSEIDPRIRNDYARFAQLGGALRALVKKMDPNAAAQMAQSLVVSLRDVPNSDASNVEDRSWRLEMGTVDTLAALADKLEPTAAQKTAQALVEILEKAPKNDVTWLTSLGNAFARIVAKMEPQAAAKIARPVAQRLMALLENPQDPELSKLQNALAALVNNMEPRAGAEVARRDAQGIVAALEQETNTDRLPELGNALAALVNKMESQAGAEVARRGAQRLVMALEDSPESDTFRLSEFAPALAALAKRMNPDAAAELTGRLSAVLTNPQEMDFSRALSLFGALTVLTDRIESEAAAEIARKARESLKVELDNPKNIASDRLWRLGLAVVALANKMKQEAATEITRQTAKDLAAALEDSQNNNFDRLSRLAYTLATLADKMEPADAAEVAKRGAQHLAAALSNPQEMDSSQLLRLGQILGAFCKFLPSTYRTHLLALSNMLLEPVSINEADGPPKYLDRKLLAEVCAELRKEDLAEALKYPLCTGDAEQIVLDQLKSMTHRDFGGDVWKLVQQANSLGIKDIKRPAQRPLAEEALNELDKM